MPSSTRIKSKKKLQKYSDGYYCCNSYSLSKKGCFRQARDLVINVMNMKIAVASNNPHKIREIRAIMAKEIGKEVEILSLHDIGYTDDIKENGASFEENALIKAHAAAHLGYISMADDSGLMVDALGGAPGIYSARYAGEPCNDRRNNEKLLTALKEVPDTERSAKFVSAIAIVFPEQNEQFTVRGECRGRILTDYRGDGGFGYDPLFLYEPLNKTFAELTAEEKNNISHRAKAMKEFINLFKNKLKEYGYTHAYK